MHPRAQNNKLNRIIIVLKFSFYLLSVFLFSWRQYPWLLIKLLNYSENYPLAKKDSDMTPVKGLGSEVVRGDIYGVKGLGSEVVRGDIYGR